MADIERILQTDSGRVGFEKTDRNMVKVANELGTVSNDVELNLSFSVTGQTIADRIKNEIAKGQLSGRYRYTSGYSSDAPIAKHGIISYKKTGQSVTTDIKFHADSGEIYTATLNSSQGTYTSGWKLHSTTDRAAISFANGWTRYVGDTSILKNGNLVTIPDLRLSGGVTTALTTLFVLPSGFRPTENTDIMCRVENTGNLTSIRAYANGDVKILYDDVPAGAKLQIRGNFRAA